MNSSQLKNRTKKYSITILDLVEKLPNTISGRAVSNQIVRSGTRAAQSLPTLSYDIQKHIRNIAVFLFKGFEIGYI